MTRFIQAVFATAIVFFAIEAVAQRSIAPNWEAEAKRYLTKDGKPFQGDAKTAPLCVVLNNYGCLMQEPPSNEWNQSRGKDAKGHAIFLEAAYGVRGMVRDLCSKHRQGLKSALAIMEKYSPWCDTQGTVDITKAGWGRTCRDDKPRAPENFTGPKCQKPESGEASSAQCASCNCPLGTARSLVRGLDVGVSDDLRLFNQDGSVNVLRLKIYLRNHFFNEIKEHVVADELLERGIRLAGICEPRRR